MKRSIPIALLFALLLQMGGILIIYRLQQCFVKYEMSRALEEQDTEYTSLVLSLAVYHDSRVNKREILHNGDLYDVKSVEFSVDSVILQVVKDEKEKKVMEKIRTLDNSTKKQKQDLPNRVERIFSVSFLYPTLNSYNIYLVQTDNFFPPVKEEQVSLRGDIPTPPPELI